MNDDGTKKFADATTEFVGQQISIIYDGETISAPSVKQAITGGQAYITGNFTYEEAENLALRSVSRFEAGIGRASF